MPGIEPGDLEALLSSAGIESVESEQVDAGLPRRFPHCSDKMSEVGEWCIARLEGADLEVEPYVIYRPAAPAGAASD